MSGNSKRAEEEAREKSMSQLGAAGYPSQAMAEPLGRIKPLPMDWEVIGSMEFLPRDPPSMPQLIAGYVC
jgi:hypothetical protein